MILGKLQEYGVKNCSWIHSLHQSVETKELNTESVLTDMLTRMFRCCMLQNENNTCSIQNVTLIVAPWQEQNLPVGGEGGDTRGDIVRCREEVRVLEVGGETPQVCHLEQVPLQAQPGPGGHPNDGK